MTEVPDYLLERSRERRKALGLDTGDGAPSVAPAASPDAPVPAGATAPGAAPAAAPAPAEAPAPPPPPPKKPWVRAYEGRKKIPVWVAPVLLFLPLWAIIYVGTLDEPTRPPTGAVAAGQELYASVCAGCHGAAGGGGSGPALSNGEVLRTFPTVEGQIAFVLNGSPAVGTPYGDPDRPGGQRIAGGGMPPHGSLSREELVGVIVYERITHGGQAAAELEPWIEFAETEGPSFPLGTTAEEILAAVSAEMGPMGEAAG